MANLEVLKNADCHVDFDTFESMTEFLADMEAADEEHELWLNKTITRGDEETNEGFLDGVTTSGNNITLPLWPFAIRSLEKRSGCDASGNALLTFVEELNGPMPIYFKKQKDKKKFMLRVRGGKVIVAGSDQYNFISQNAVLSAVAKHLEDQHPGAWHFVDGFYTHTLTCADFKIDDALSPAYVAAWKKAGLPQSLLDMSCVTFSVMTDDIAGCAAKAIIKMKVGKTDFLLGNPIEVQHRNGYGGIEAFIDKLSKADISIKEELDALANLMTVNLLHPANAGIMALKKAGMPIISKKACKELIDDMMFGSTETAYIVYLFLHGFVSTSYGAKLSEERKLRAITALRSLLKEDWKKLDVPSASL